MDIAPSSRYRDIEWEEQSRKRSWELGYGKRTEFYLQFLEGDKQLLLSGKVFSKSEIPSEHQQQREFRRKEKSHNYSISPMKLNHQLKLFIGALISPNEILNWKISDELKSLFKNSPYEEIFISIDRSYTSPDDECDFLSDIDQRS